jgi:hypothetical protein
MITETEAFHEAAHGVVASEIGIKILGITTKADSKGRYSAALVAENHRDWILAGPEDQREKRAASVLRMLQAGPIVDRIRPTTDPLIGFRAASDQRDTNRIRREFIPAERQEVLMEEIERELSRVFSDAESAESKALNALASRLLKAGDDGLDGEEVAGIVAPFLTHVA